MKHSINVEVKLQRDETEERLIKRFFKKVKKFNIIEEFLEKTSFYKKPSVKRRDKERNIKFFKTQEKE